MRSVAILAFVLAGLLWSSSANADDSQPLTLTITQNQAKIADALAVLRQESGETIVVDGTVVGRMGPGKVSFATLPMMIEFLKTMEPGLTSTQIYIAKDKPTPNALDCYNVIKAMEWLSNEGNPVLVTPTGALSIAAQAAPPATTPPGMRLIWYISDEQMRAQEVLDQQQAAQQAAQGQLQTGTSGQQLPQTPGTRQQLFQVSPGLVIQR